MLHLQIFAVLFESEGCNLAYICRIWKDGLADVNLIQNLQAAQGQSSYHVHVQVYLKHVSYPSSEANEVRQEHECKRKKELLKNAFFL